MIDSDEIMPLNFFSYGGVYSGQHNNMRYRLAREGEKPDFRMKASWWRGPYSYDATLRLDDDTLIRNKEFEYTQEGRAAAIEWLMEEYNANQLYLSEAPALLKAPIDLNRRY